MTRARRAARWVSTFFSGAVGIGAFVVLGILGVVGTILTASDLLNLAVDPAVLLLPSALAVAANVIYREVQRRKDAERERDAAERALKEKPDDAAIVRLFLRLHDYGPKVLEPFHEPIEQLPKTMEEGEQRHIEWVKACTEAIAEFRPTYALRFRETLGSQRKSSMGMWIIVKDDEGKDVYVDMDRVSDYDDRVARSMAVLADIIKAG